MTAKVRCVSKMEFPNGDYVQVAYAPDYDDGANAEWANATPSLMLTMNVKKSVAENIEQGGKYTLTFEPNDG